MTPERWQEVKDIFRSALELAPVERAAFLDRACAGDELLRREVESLLRSHDESDTFMETPALENTEAAQMIVGAQSKLQPGQRVGHYEIVRLAGEGGMGEVYLAEDPRLGRKVALKFLPSSLAGDKDRLRRFEQEARAASALNHPNIVTIYEIHETNSTLMIATEFIEGETLRQRLTGGGLDLDEALHVAIQIADALAAAHKAGIIHRDIKPENIMIRPDGYVKVLDFGLAKLIEHASAMSVAEAPTKRVKTGSGVIMGTVGYMSPEQARGQAVDARSDIFNLGAVIYEMIAGQKPFDGETPSDVFAAILKTEPPLLSHFTPEAPAELVRIVNKALRKDREKRYQVVKELLLDLKSLKEDVDFQAKLDRSIAPAKSVEALDANSQSQLTATAKPPSETSEIKTAVSTITHSLSAEIRRHKVGAILAVTVIVVAMIAGVFGLYKFLNRSRATVPASTEAPSVGNITRITTWSGLDTQPTLAPDGNSVAYSSDHNGGFEIYVKQLTPGGREIQLTSDGRQNFQPAWSPDRQHIAYYSKMRSGIWVLPTSGGAPQQLTEFGSSPAWSRDGTMIVFQSDSDPVGIGAVGSSTIWVVAAQGGAPKQLTKIGNPAGGHINPTWSPDGRRIAFVAINFLTPQIWSVSVSGYDPKQMTHAEGRPNYPVYSPEDGNLYYVLGPTVWRQRVSPESGSAVDDPVKTADIGTSSVQSITFSADGKRMACSVQTLTSNIWSVPVSKNTNEAAGPPRPIMNQTGTRNTQPIFSPDGRRIAFAEWLTGGGTDIWVADPDGKNPVQVTTNPRNAVPSWFPDGDQIAFVSRRDGRWGVWAISLQSRRQRPLLNSSQDIEYARLAPDGKQIAFNLTKSGITNVWVASVGGGNLKQLTFDQELAGFPCWSPDGQYLAFNMKRGDDSYVMVMPSGGGEPVQLTFDHGLNWPNSWSADGERVAFAGARDGVWNVYWVSRSTKQQKQLTNYTKLNAYVRYPAWSPLGNQMVYEYAETTGNIWMMELK